MLKVIKRVLRLSGDLSKRIYASFVFSFIDSIVAMFPVGAVFYTLTKIQNNKAFTGNDWLVIFGILLISLVVRMVFKYLVYSFQSTAGFEFVSRERITLGDKLRNVGMGFFHERNMGDITTTVTTDLNFLENYSMHLLDRVTTGMVNMVVTSIFILMFDWRLGVIFILGVLCSFLIYGRMQKKGEELTAKQRQVQAASVEATLEYVQGICKIGIPTALQGMVYCFISMVLTRMVAGFGPEAIATQRVGGQIESISWNTADGFGAAMNAFIGQNYGAGKTERVKKGYRASLCTVGIWGILITLVFVVVPVPIASVFFHEKTAIATAVDYLIIVGYSEAFLCVELMTVGALSGLGRTRLCSVISIVFTSLRIPLAIILSSGVLGILGIWWALTTTTMMKGIIFTCAFFIIMRKMTDAQRTDII